MIKRILCHQNQFKYLLEQKINRNKASLRQKQMKFY